MVMKMEMHFYKDDQGMVFGIRYSKFEYLMVKNSLSFSFWKWDLEINW
jgi:hypothetical protein